LGGGRRRRILIERRVSCPVSSLLATVYSEHNGLNLWR
jgi:hypothetical protein